MIRIHVTRVEDDGAETELGEIRMAELGAEASYREMADGAGVMPDVRAAFAPVAGKHAAYVRTRMCSWRAGRP